METTQTMELLLWLYKSKAEVGEKAPIYARIMIDGDYSECSLGVKVLPENWDGDGKRLLPGDDDHENGNLKILQSVASLKKHFTALSVGTEKVTPEMVKIAFKGKKKSATSKSAENRPQTFIAVFDEFINQFKKKVEKNKRSDGRYRHWRSTRTKMRQFLVSKHKKQDVEVTAIKPIWADDLYDYLTVEVAKPLSEVTAKKHIKNVRQILDICVKSQWITVNPFSMFCCSGGEQEVEPLEYDEVFAIYNKNLFIERLSEVRDGFIFQCFTGYAYQEILNLTPDNIISLTRKGKTERWLVKDRGKTGVSEAVPILPVVEDLIQKYAGHPCRLNDNRLMPIKSNFHYNGYLKEIAVLCGITRENVVLDTHLARHTFAHIMLNICNVPIEDVSKMMGHKSIRTTQKYCRVYKERISKNMAVAQKQMFTKEGKLKMAV